MQFVIPRNSDATIERQSHKEIHRKY